MAPVNNSATPTVNLPPSGVPGGNLNQSFVVTANAVYRFRLAVEVRTADQTATYEMTLDPTIVVNPAFAATHPGYTMSFSPGFGPPPSVQIQTVATNVVITWPVSATGCVLETTGDLAATNSWTTVTNVPTVVGPLNTVTNPISGAAHFYRLKN